MFERNRINNVVSDEKHHHPVRITLDDGTTLRGRMSVARSRSINDELNSDGGFVVFEPYRGDQLLLAKGSIRSLSITNVPRANQLEGRNGKGGDFDPHLVLGLVQGADHDTVQKAYRRLAKAYHPDRYAHQDLPDEILEYACEMAGRINLAYSELNKLHQQEEELKARRQATMAASQARFNQAGFGV